MQMTMRLYTTRQTSIGDDEYGGPLPASPRPLLDAEPCYAWAPTDIAHVMDDVKLGVIGALRIVVALGTDIVHGDVVAEIADRRGVTLFDGPLRVTAVTRRAGHLAVMVRAQAPTVVQ